MQLVKRTQKDWTCFLCKENILIGSSMFRETFSRWVEPNTYCLKCSKPLIEEKIKEIKRHLNDKNMPTILVEDSKNVLKYYEDCMNVINA